MTLIVAVLIVLSTIGGQNATAYNNSENIACKWHTSGGFSIPWDWGDNLDDVPTSQIRVAFQTGITNWNDVYWNNDIEVYLQQYSVNRAEFNSSYVPFDGPGWATHNCNGTLIVDSLGIINSWNYNNSGASALAAHEIGHVMGLGHSNVSQAIMGENPNTLDDPQQDDIDGINSLYP